MVYSETCLKMIQSKIGYRDDTAYNSGICNFSDILSYEVFELGNEDILRMFKNFYGLKINLRNKKKSIEKILNFCYNRYNSKVLYAKWLTTKENVLELYGNTISEYAIPDDFLVASDLEKDGVLFVSKTIITMKQ